MRRELVGLLLATSFGLNGTAMAVQQQHAPAADRHKAEAQLSAANSRFKTSNQAQDKAHTKQHQAAPAKTSGKNALTALNQGILLYQRGNIGKAIPCFLRAIAQSPQNDMAHLWLARAYQKQGTLADQMKAKTSFQDVLKLNPDQLEALTSLGEMWSWDPAMRGEAIHLLKHAQELNPKDVEISRKLAEALFWQGNSTEALHYAKPIAQCYANDRKWMSEYAQMLSANGQSEEALRIYETVLKEDSARSLSLQLDTARALAKNGQKEKAMALYEQISQKLNTTPKAKTVDFTQSMASLAFELERYNDVLTWDQSLPNATQAQKDVQLRDARALTRSSRVPEAIDRFNRLYESGLLSISEKLEYAEYLRLLHLAPEAMPSPNLVANLYQEAAQEAPNNPEVAVKLARLYAEQENQFDETVKAYEQALGSATLSDRLLVQKEFLDYVKTDKGQPLRVEAMFKKMLAETPDDLQVKLAYAEFLSWQKDRRTEALHRYVELGKLDTANQATWEARIEEVLKWQQPTTTLIPLYQEIVNQYPANKTIWLTVARAYRNDKNYYKEAVETYGILVKRYADDRTIKREWLSLLLSNPGQRGENIRTLKKMTADNPDDLDILATYGKLLSYDHQYGAAMTSFDKVLAKNPEHREALVGKGYVILWSGRKLEAKSFFHTLRKQYPDDVDIAIGLAQSEKLIGRYDEAFKIIQEIKPLMDQNGQKAPEASSAVWSLNPEFLPVANLVSEKEPLMLQAVFDFSVQPVVPVPTPEVTATVAEIALSDGDSVLKPSENSSESLHALQSEIDDLSEAVKTLKLLQNSSRSQLDRLGSVIHNSRDTVPSEMSLQPAEQNPEERYASTARIASGSGTQGGKSHLRSVGQDGMTSEYGEYGSLDADTNPLLSGLGRFRNDDLVDLEKGLSNELRPMIRGGFMYSRRQGEATTTQLSSWGFPNQLSFSLTPQIRVRGGIKPTRYYLPNGLSPSQTWGIDYGLGATIKYWDRLTLDGDMAITQFSQSKSSNLTFQTQAQYAFTDSIRAKVGISRLPVYNSLLSVTGLRPNQGAFSGNLVGQTRENSVYAELNTNPFNQNWDLNAGYSWSFVDGSRTPTNRKNQVFASLGHTWHYSPNHQVRLGYEFLYFGYAKNATNGYFDTTANGATQPVVSLNPVIRANSGYVFGGYYSPSLFIMNAGRLDFRGSLFNKFIEYKIGGSLGAQTARLGHGIKENSGTSLSSAFDTNVILNVTDWLAAYGDVDYLDAGGQFNRWRFGGGLIVRPHIRALSPLIGGSRAEKKSMAPATAK